MKRYLLLASFVMFVLVISSLVFAVEGSLTITWQVLDATLRPGGETTVLLTLTNPSTVGVRTIELFISSGPYITPSTSYLEIGGLGGGESQQTSLIVNVDSTAISTTSYIKIKATYYGDSTKKETIINIPIKIRRVPILQIEGVNYTPTLIEPGNTVNLSFDLINNGDGPAKDISIALNQIEKVFVTELEETFVSEIKSGQKTQISFTLMIDPSVAIGTYSIPVSLEYLDETKTENYSSTKNIGLVIAGKYNFVITLESQSVVAQDTQGSATVKIANAGTQKARFLTVKVLPSDALIDISPKSIYIGNLKSDDYETGEFNFKVDKLISPGSYPLNLEIEYKDLYGQAYTETYEVDIKVSSTAEFSQAYQTRISWYIIGIVGLFAIVFIYYIYRRLRKKK